ncbi:MAG: acetyl-CoA carboxylase biotin carboxyl carrier protein [Rhodospirillales bacterium]|nr:acetyl-CoA carboxylase biotin carboxyl carrier protein [Rhodospirillales bacterium]
MAEPKDKDKKDKGAGESSATGIDAARVRELSRLLAETSLDEIEYAGPDWRVRVVRRSARPPGAPAHDAQAGAAGSPGESAAPAPEIPADHPGLVKSPMVGVVFTASDSAAPPFVRVGDQIAEGQTLVLIEAMKVFNPIKSPRAGKLARIFVASGTPVEYGEPLMLIE